MRPASMPMSTGCSLVLRRGARRQHCAADDQIHDSLPVDRFFRLTSRFYRRQNSSVRCVLSRRQYRRAGARIRTGMRAYRATYTRLRAWRRRAYTRPSAVIGIGSRHMKTIGVIGGMSWESSTEYYKLLNRHAKARLGGHHNARSLMLTVDFAPIEANSARRRLDRARPADGRRRASTRTRRRRSGDARDQHDASRV